MIPFGHEKDLSVTQQRTDDEGKPIPSKTILVNFIPQAAAATEISPQRGHSNALEAVIIDFLPFRFPTRQY